MGRKNHKQGICKFCGQYKRLVDSHIIPRGLYMGLDDKKGKVKVAQLVSPFEGEYQMRRRIGIYDQFLCNEHEELFQQWDDYAITLLRITEPTPVDDGWRFEDVNYDLLKLFFISLLWRAHATDNSFFNIDLGSHGNILKKHILDKDPGIPEEYAVLLGRSEEDYSQAIIAPMWQQVDGVNFIRFYLPGYIAIIKVDSEPLPMLLKKSALAQSDTWFVPCKQYEGKIEEKIILKTAEINWNRKNGSKR